MPSGQLPTLSASSYKRSQICSLKDRAHRRSYQPSGGELTHIRSFDVALMLLSNGHLFRTTRLDITAARPDTCGAV